MSAASERAQSIVQPYLPAIGKQWEELATPALLLEVEAARANLRRMAARLTGPARLRPHVKLHKCPQLARWQVEAGAIGVTTATVQEAAAMVEAGIPEILIANQVVGAQKVRAVAALAGKASLLVAIDDAANAEVLAAAAQQAGTTLGVLIDVDTGMNRGGVRSPQEALDLAARLSHLPGLRLRGVTGYEGHCVLVPDRAERGEKAGQAMDYLLEVVDLLAGAGHCMEIVSAGGTGTYDMTGLHPRVTEIQAGSYLFMDAARMPLLPDFGPALTVLCTVVSRHGATSVLDGGRKTIGAEIALPLVVGGAATTRAINEEHVLLDGAEGASLRVGDTVRMIPGYAPTTVNLHEVYHVVKDGVVQEIWPVMARGASLAGL
jgi:D-serine deaminase-like pyridoxal phosphate-dependent protein